MVKDVVNASKQLMEKGDKLTNKFKVGPHRVYEKALHKSTPLVEYKLIWFVYKDTYSSGSVVSSQHIVGAFHFLGRGVFVIPSTKGWRRLLQVAMKLLVTPLVLCVRL